MLVLILRHHHSILHSLFQPHLELVLNCFQSKLKRQQTTHTFYTPFTESSKADPGALVSYTLGYMELRFPILY